jgi:hypothetical protein
MMSTQEAVVRKKSLAVALIAILVVAVTGGVTGQQRPAPSRAFGLTPLDPATFIGVAALFALVGTLAALIPAHRAITFLG